MDSRKISNLFLALVALSFCTSVAFAENHDVADDKVVATPKPPYTAQITGDNVYVRSGAGTDHYRCGKLYRGDSVKVVSIKNAWSRILPTKNNFSWVSKQYVVIDNTNPDIGIVSTDNARVYSGSEYIEPIHSDKVQLKLNKGDKVVLLGEELQDYYKIKPPDGTYFWVNTQYTQPVEVRETQLQKSTPAEVKVVPPKKEQPKLEIKLPEPEAVVPTNSPENPQAAKRLKAYYLVQDLVKVEYAKPLAQQDYSNSKNALAKLIEEDNTDKASRYADFLLNQIKRFELAAKVEKENELLNSQLKRVIKKIDNAHTERKTEFRDLGQYAVMGTIKKSNVYGPEQVLLHYTVVDSADKIICYALPAAPAGQTNIESYVGQKVGLIGTIEPHPQTSGALVRFTAIESIN